jgi:HSP20 family protein
MADKDLVKLNGTNGTNGTNTNLTVQHNNEQSYPTLYREMSEWMNQWNQWFDNTFGRAFGLTPFRSTDERWGNLSAPLGQWGNLSSTFMPAVNVSETDKEYHVTAELPGMDEKDIELTLNRDALIIRGEKKQETEDKGKGYYRMERSYGTFHRSIPLPQEIDADHVNASFNKGVLTITLPKLPEIHSGAKKIQIRTEK